VHLITPLWLVPPASVMQALIDLDIKAVVSCVALAKFAALPPPAAETAAEAEADAADAAEAAEAAPQSQEYEPQEGEQGGINGSSSSSKKEAGDQGSSCQCHCSAAPPLPPGPPRFDAVGRLLGRPITQSLIDGALADAAAATEVDLAGEDGAYHSIVTDCPLMRRGGGVMSSGGGNKGSEVGVGVGPMRLSGRPFVDKAIGYAYVQWD